MLQVTPHEVPEQLTLPWQAEVPQAMVVVPLAVEVTVLPQALVPHFTSQLVPLQLTAPPQAILPVQSILQSVAEQSIEPPQAMEPLQSILHFGPLHLMSPL